MDVYFNRKPTFPWEKTFADIYLYKAGFIRVLLKESEWKLVRSFDFTFRYIDDVVSLNNSRLSDFVDCIYPIEHELNDAMDTAMCASYFMH